MMAKLLDLPQISNRRTYNIEISNKSRQFMTKPHWFTPSQLDGYRPPTTLHAEDLFDPLSKGRSSSKKHRDFDKSKRVSPFEKKTSGPAPNRYSLDIKKDRSQSSAFGKQKRFGKEIKNQMGVGAYTLHKNLEGHSFQNGSTTLPKGEKKTYFDQAQYAGHNLPGPGQYHLSRPKKSHSLGNLPQASKTASTNSVHSVAKQRKGKDLGPWSYQTRKEHRDSCSAVLKTPQFEQDENIRRRVLQMRKNKAEQNKTGPGKYLKIEDWGNYKKNQLKNGFTVCSKPVLRIYN